MMTLGNRLKECRLYKKLSQESMAVILNCSLRSLRNYETNERSPNSETLNILLKEGFNVNWLLTGEGEMLIKDQTYNNTVVNDVINLMAFIVKTVDEWLDDNDRELAPEKKSDLIKMIFKELQKNGKIDFKSAPANVKSIMDIINHAA